MHISTAEALTCTGQRHLQDIIEERRFRSVGHIMWTASVHPAHCAMDWTQLMVGKEAGQRRSVVKHS